MNRLLNGLVVLSLGACSVIPESQMFEPKARIVSRVVTVHTGTPKQVINACRTLTRHPNAHACAMWTDTHCTIYVPEKTSYHALGHEMRHCTEGNFHE